MITATRGANLQDMVEILKTQRARRHDVVVPASKLRFEESRLVLKGYSPMMDDDGVTEVDGSYQPTEIFDGNIAYRLGLPPQFLRQLRSGGGPKNVPPRPDLYDQLVNGYLHGRREKIDFTTRETTREAVPGFDKLSLLRLFVSDDGEGNIARALLSNRFPTTMDNLDALMAMLQGIERAGIDPGTLLISGDLSESRMYIKVSAPEIFVEAPGLLQGYRSPFDDPGVAAQRASWQKRINEGRIFQEGGRAALEAAQAVDGSHIGVKRGEEPIMYTGFVLSNSEIGQGKWSIHHQVITLACANGQTREQDAVERTHLGTTLKEGAVKWSAETIATNGDLISSMTTDAVRSFLDRNYLQAAVDDLTTKGTKQLGPKAHETITEVLKSRTIAFDQTAIDGIMSHFMMAGQRTSGGLMQAITSYSQTVESADEANDLDGKAIRAMELAYAAS